MADSKQKDDDRYSDEETKRRMDEALKRALTTPPKPSKPKPKHDDGKEAASPRDTSHGYEVPYEDGQPFTGGS